MGCTSPLRRLVDEYTKGQDGRYFLSRHDVEFVEYLHGEQYALIPVSEQNQIDYGCNGLSLGNGSILISLYYVIYNSCILLEIISLWSICIIIIINA